MKQSRFQNPDGQRNSNRNIFTVWKNQDFSVIQILREINFGECESSKTDVFAIFEALNFVDLQNFSLQKVQNFTRFKIHSL